MSHVTPFADTRSTSATMNFDRFEQIGVLVVVCITAIIFFGIFVIFFCRCSKRCPSYRYSRALFDNHRPCLPDQLLAVAAYPGSFTPPTQTKRRTDDEGEAGSPLPLPPYSEEWAASSVPRSPIPPPNYDLIGEPRTLSRPPSYRSLEDRSEMETTENRNL